MHTPKYQIFVSSTYIDLKREREQVIRTILEMGHVPVGMEMFSAGDQEQWEIITSHIDQSDYYVVLVAHRYGSVADDGRSYTEKEYDYAVEKQIPTIGFVIADGVSWDPKFIEAEQQTRDSLAGFKSKVKKKHIAFWTSAEDLGSRVSIALMKQFHIRPRPGWTRASMNSDARVVEELARLSLENAQLRAALNAARQMEFRTALERADRLLREADALPRKPGGLSQQIVEPAAAIGWLSAVRQHLAETHGLDSDFYRAVLKESLIGAQFTSANISIVSKVLHEARRYMEPVCSTDSPQFEAQASE